mgnify:CR=1 FL=1
MNEGRREGLVERAVGGEFDVETLEVVDGEVEGDGPAGDGIRAERLRQGHRLDTEVGGRRVVAPVDRLLFAVGGQCVDDQLLHHGLFGIGFPKTSGKHHRS